MVGKLLVGSMPIGHKDDITIRMINALKSCDLILSDSPLFYLEEILSDHDIQKEIVFLNSTNTMYADEAQVNDMELRITNGQTVVLVSSEGQVGIADPGNQFIQRCIDKDLPYTVLPGPNSAINSFVLSGLTNGDFLISSNMEDQKVVIDQFSQENNPTVILVWQRQLEDILQHISQTYSRNVKYKKKITICCNMTMASELVIHDWCDKILDNDKLKTIPPGARLSIVISGFYHNSVATHEESYQKSHGNGIIE
jgi:16S rRNA (cytidine1402-2'-O)-methyltransferase